MKKINKKILVMTPVNDKLLKKINSMFIDVYYNSDIEKDEFVNIVILYKPDILFVNPNKQKFKLDEDVLKYNIKNLKTIITASTGTHHINLECCEKNDIEVISLTKDIKTLKTITSTAEHAFFLMGSLIRNIPASFNNVKQYEWNYEPFVGRQLNKMSIGIVGVGRLGTMMANYCESFDMDVQVYDPYVNQNEYLVPVHKTLKSLYKAVNIISIHVHLNDETRNLFNEELFNNSTDKYIINTSRGAIVNELDILDALTNGNVKGYATDVLTDELGNIEQSALIRESHFHNIIITPHLGGSTLDAMEIAYNRVLNIYKEKINEKS